MHMTLCGVVQAREGMQTTATTTRSTNIHGDALYVTTQSPYEQVWFLTCAAWFTASSVAELLMCSTIS